MEEKDKELNNQNEEKNYSEKFIEKGEAVSEIADKLRNKAKELGSKSENRNISNIQDNNRDDNRGKKKKLIIIIILMAILIGAGVVMALVLTSSSRTEVEFRLKNIDARIVVECNRMNPNGNNKEILVNGKSEEIISIEPEQNGQENTLNKVLRYDDYLEINEGDYIRFDYTIQNRSSEAGMYIDFSKINSNDYNFKIQVRYQLSSGGEQTLLTYFAGGENNLYYPTIDDLNNNVGGVENLATQNAIYLAKNSSVKIVVEMSIIDYSKDASCNCNHIFDLVNENSR